MTRRMLFVAGTLALCLSASLTFAQPAGGPPGGGPGGPPMGPRNLPIMAAIVIDADHNGELSAEEIAAAAEVLKKLDKNGDGKLDRDELRPQMPGRDGQRPGARPGTSGRTGSSQGGQSSVAEKAPQGKDDKEKAILAALEEIAQAQGRMMNVPTTDGRLLRLLAEAIDAKKVVEIGTSNGISAIWIGNALRKTGGKLFTYEIDAQRAELARKNFEKAGLTDLITVIEGDAHELVKKQEGPIDMVFIDADKSGYLDYLQKLLPLVRPGGLIMAHNMTERMADAKFVEAITTNPDLETLFYRQGGGMSISMKKR